MLLLLMLLVVFVFLDGWHKKDTSYELSDQPKDAAINHIYGSKK